MLLSRIVPQLSLACLLATVPAAEVEAASVRPSAVLDEQSIELEAGGSRFTALYRESTIREQRGGIILAHETDGSADAQGLAHALRGGLPRRGWSVLALPAPDALTSAGPEFAEMAQRVQSALEFLKTKQIEAAILIAYRRAGAGILRYLAEHADAPVRAVVLVDLQAMSDPAEPDTALETVGKTQLPVLDLLSHGAAGAETERRRRLFKNDGAYRQDAVIDATAGLESVQEMVINRIHGWLSRLPGPPPKAPVDPGPAM